MVAALEFSKYHPTTLISRQLPSANDAPRVEAVPASLLALLVEFGIHPRRIGVERLHESRLVAWEQEAVFESLAPVAAHVERPALDLALLGVVVTSRRVNLRVSQQANCFSAAIAAARNQEVRLIDATGRRAVSAGKRIHPAKPWAARTLMTSRRSCTADSKLRIAALPGGFVYRLGAANHIVLGIVGRRKPVVGDHSTIEQHLHEYGAEWILEGLPPIADMTPGRISPASVQWTSGTVGIRVGDAALARDTLSSQGLAAGISEALYAAAIKGHDDEALLSVRQVEQKVSHLRSLGRVIARCRFREQESWRQYAEFVVTNLEDKALSTVALREGQVHNYGTASPMQGETADGALV